MYSLTKELDSRGLYTRIEISSFRNRMYKVAITSRYPISIAKMSILKSGIHEKQRFETALAFIKFHFKLVKYRLISGQFLGNNFSFEI